MTGAVTVPVALRVNGEARALDLDPRTSLLDALRDHLGLTGSKKGCNHGQCAACTVPLDGRRVNACLVLAVSADGAAVTTVEDLAPVPDPVGAAGLHPVQAAFLAGGTNLVDLMRYGIEALTTLVDITRLHLAAVEPLPGGGVRIGALVRNADLADHPHIWTHFPLLSQALLSGASPQLRNVATTGGNLLQHTRCSYFNDASFSRCNKRVPGSGCAAIAGQNRIHAILGQADSGVSCIATHPSDMCVALAALDAAVEIQGMGGTRTVPFAGFHRLPGATPWIDTVLRPGELVVAVTLPLRFAGNSHYLKARDRRSHAYALVSVAAGLEFRDGVVAGRLQGSSRDPAAGRQGIRA